MRPAVPAVDDILAKVKLLQSTLTAECFETLRSAVQQSIELAMTDPLTGLYNRRYLEMRSDLIVQNARNRRRSCSLLLIDLDLFKAVNDVCGHEAGDRVLKQVAQRIRRTVRRKDVACRLGGEEFVVLLPDTDVKQACRVAERLRRAMGARPFEAGPLPAALAITISVGVAGLEGPGDGIEAMLKRADAALYRAKHEGRNQIVAAAA